ncbi:MAG: hypothetical protein JWM93_3325 [Frankiales bacterium]|nr:hypothetical protein [Frankiales bacterium]
MTAAATAVRARVALVPTKPELVDAGLLVTLTAIALLSFRFTYGGTGYLTVGGGALVFAIVLAHITNRLALPVLALATVTVLAFFLLGGLVGSVDSPLPTPGAVRALGRTSVRGWMDLLTTSPPVGNAGQLLALPYLLCLGAGVSGYVLARRTTRVSAPLFPPTVVLILGIVFGTPQPPMLILHGGAYAGIAFLWAAIRRERRRPQRLYASSSVATGRRISAALMVAIVSCVGYLAGPHLPFTHGQERVVARSYVTPPFDPSSFPSPLAGFRKYVKNSPLNEKTLFTVTGVAAGTHVRVATMTGYDGLVWGVAGAQDVAADGQFTRVGSTLPHAPTGASHQVTVTIGQDFNDVWLPNIDGTTGITFSGERAAALTEQFRYDVETSTGVLTSRLRAADEIKLVVVEARQPNLTSGTTAGSPLIPADRMTWATATAAQWGGAGTDDWGKIEAIAAHLKDNGRYSDGSTIDEARFRAGHSIGALRGFLSAPQLVGNDEQYAAVLGVMANATGVPARVVLGGTVEPDGSVKGKDMRAWVEVAISGSGWVPIYPEAFIPDTSKKPDAAQAQSNAAAQHAQVPPPVAQRSKNDIDTPDDSDTKSDQRKDEKKTAVKPPIIPAAVRHLLVYAAAPIGLVALIVGIITLLKLARRRSRRRKGSLTKRFAGGWADLVDCATDLGVDVPQRRTRNEQSAVLVEPARALAREADAAIFGPGDPVDDDVAAYWKRVAATRRELRRGAPRLRRLRAVVTTRSLRGVAARERNVSRSAERPRTR